MAEEGKWPDPARPGVPMNPEKDGWHWFFDTNEPEFMAAAFWRSCRQDWHVDGEDLAASDLETAGYGGPCLTPADHAAAVAQARAEAVPPGWKLVPMEPTEKM